MSLMTEVGPYRIFNKDSYRMNKMTLQSSKADSPL